MHLLCDTAPRTGGPVHQHAAESGSEPYNHGHAGGLLGLLYRSERQSYHREAQGELEPFLAYHFISEVLCSINSSNI